MSQSLSHPFLNDVEGQERWDRLQQNMHDIQKIAAAAGRLTFVGTVNRSMNIGTVAVVFSGATSTVTTGNIPHGLAAAPVNVQVTSETAFLDSACTFRDATNIRITVYTTSLTNAAAGTYTMDWLAIA